MSANQTPMLLSGNHAVAWAARLARPKVVPVYPITPQTPILELLTDFHAQGEFDAEILTPESEHSVLSACIPASLAGARVFTATASQGLLLMHELLHYAKSKGRQLEMKERLLQAYFVNGEHVGRIEDLADIAAELDFDRADVVRALESNEFLAAVKADVAQAQEYGIQGVPFFVIDGRYGISGAQEAATFAAALQQVRDEKEAAA